MADATTLASRSGRAEVMHVSRIVSSRLKGAAATYTGRAFDDAAATFEVVLASADDVRRLAAR